MPRSVKLQNNTDWSCPLVVIRDVHMNVLASSGEERQQMSEEIAQAKPVEQHSLNGMFTVLHEHGWE